MGINNNFIVCYDLETTGLNPHEVEIVDIAAVVIHPRKLEIVQGGTFQAFAKPPNYESISSELWQFHAKANQISVEEMKAKINNAAPISNVWHDFANFLGQFHTEGCKRKSIFSAPIRAGMNIIAYDNIIWQRMCERYGMVDKDSRQNLAFSRDNIDLLNICFLWFENQQEPAKYNMDTLKPYFGIKSVGHTALTDVTDTANLICRFMKLHRSVNVKFKGALSATNSPL